MHLNCKLITFLCLSAICLLGCGTHMSKADCKAIVSESDEIVNKHFEKQVFSPEDFSKEDTIQLELALTKLGGIYNKCPSIEPVLVSRKIRLFLLLENYERGYAFVDSLEASAFEWDYAKNMYYHTFKARFYEKQGNLKLRDEEAQTAVREIEHYINKNPTDKDAIASLAYTMTIYSDEATVIARLDQMPPQGNIGDLDFLEGLKNSISNYYMTMKK